MVVPMRTEPVTDRTNFDQPVVDAGPSLRALIAYEDLVAGLRAMSLLSTVCRQPGTALKSQVLPWSFELLAEPDWARAAAREATRADLLIITSRSPRPLPSAVLQWVQATLVRPPGKLAAVVALFNPEAAGEPGARASFEALKTTALNAGITYLSPAPRWGIETVLAGIHRRAARALPLNRQVAKHHPSASRNQLTLQSS